MPQKLKTKYFGTSENAQKLSHQRGQPLKGEKSMTDRKKVIKDLEFCKELMDRLVIFAKKQENAGRFDDKHTVIQADIISLRRELNQIRRELDWDYEVTE